MIFWVVQPLGDSWKLQAQAKPQKFWVGKKLQDALYLVLFALRCHKFPRIPKTLYLSVPSRENISWFTEVRWGPIFDKLFTGIMTNGHKPYQMIEETCCNRDKMKTSNCEDSYWVILSTDTGPKQLWYKFLTIVVLFVVFQPFMSRRHQGMPSLLQAVPT